VPTAAGARGRPVLRRRGGNPALAVPAAHRAGYGEPASVVVPVVPAVVAVGIVAGVAVVVVLLADDLPSSVAT
jgi:hypothetical protein